MIQLQILNAPSSDEPEEEIATERRRWKDPCWNGYHQVGMKEKDGRLVPNCVPDEDDEETAGDALYYLQPDGSYKRGGDGRSVGLTEAELPADAVIAHVEDEETAAVVDPGDYDWWTYKGARAFNVKNAKGNRTATLREGDRFGMRDGPNDTCRLITEDHGPTILFTITNSQADRLEERSRRYHPRNRGAIERAPKTMPKVRAKQPTVKGSSPSRQPAARVPAPASKPALPVTKPATDPNADTPTPPEVRDAGVNLVNDGDILELYRRFKAGESMRELVPEASKRFRADGLTVLNPLRDRFGFILAHPSMPGTRYILRADQRPNNTFGFMWGRLK